MSGIDLSLTSTGVARVRCGPGVVRAGVEVELHRVLSGPPKGRAKGVKATMLERHQRMQSIRDRIAAILLIGGPPDLVLLEGPSLGSQNSSPWTDFDIAGNWWRTAEMILDRGWRLVEVAPSSLKLYVTGKGTASKDAMVLAVERRFGYLAKIDGNDQADALGLAVLGCRYLGHPIEESLPAKNLTAMENIHWHEPRETLL